MRKFLALILTIVVGSGIWIGFMASKDTHSNQEQITKDCEIPEHAKLIGHEDLWLKHNGCPPRIKG
jgi:hypothetical protein